MKVVDPSLERNKTWVVTIRVSRYLDKVFKKLGSEGQFGPFMTS